MVVLAYRHLEEHVAVLIQVLEPARVVGEFIPVVRGAGVAQEDALHLPREIRRHLRIILHHVAVARVCHEDKLPLRIRLEDLGEEVLAYAQGGLHITEVQRPGVEGAAGVGFVDEVHVVARDLFRGGGEVVEVEVGDGARPVGVDVRHIFPLDKRPSEGVEETFFRLIDFRDAENIVDVANDCHARRRDEVSGRIANIATLGIDVQALDVGGFVAVCKAIALDRHKPVEVALGCRGVWKFNLLTPAVGRDGTASTWFSRGSGGRGWLQLKGNILIALLDHEDLSGEIPGLICLVRR